MRQYETTFVIDTHLADEAIEKAIEKYKDFISGNGGTVINVDRWGKRRLAYEIRKKQYGYYVCIRFEADATFNEKLEKEFKLDGSILRYLTLLISKAQLQEEARLKARKSRNFDASGSKPEQAPEKIETEGKPDDQEAPKQEV